MSTDPILAVHEAGVIVLQAINADREEFARGIAGDGPGRYEGMSDRVRAIAAAIDILGAHGIADDSGGDTEAAGYGIRAGRYVLVTDGQGFRTLEDRLTTDGATARLDELAEAPYQNEPPTGCAYCLDRIAGRVRRACPSHGDEWEVGS